MSEHRRAAEERSSMSAGWCNNRGTRVVYR
jgi:hypothetical protein